MDKFRAMIQDYYEKFPDQIGYKKKVEELATRKQLIAELDRCQLLVKLWQIEVELSKAPLKRRMDKPCEDETAKEVVLRWADRCEWCHQSLGPAPLIGEPIWIPPLRYGYIRHYCCVECRDLEEASWEPEEGEEEVYSFEEN